MRDLTDELGGLRRRLTEAGTYLDLDGGRKRMAELETELARPDLWNDADAGQRITREYGQVKADVDEMDGLESRLSDAETLYELAVSEDDESVTGELLSAVASLESDLDRLELRSLFTGEHDSRDAVAEIHAGEGGTDACPA